MSGVTAKADNIFRYRLKCCGYRDKAREHILKEIIDQCKVILLKGEFAISRFRNLLEHYRTAPQKGSPFDAVFLAYGRQVFRIQDIHLSYQDVCQLEGRQFFCVRNQHVIGCNELHIPLSSKHLFTQDLAPKYAESFSNYIQSHNPTLITGTLNDLSAIPPRKMYWMKSCIISGIIIRRI